MSIHYKIILGLSLFTFPGIIIHEASHLLMCIIRNVEVTEISYFEINVERNILGKISHVETNIVNDMLISYAPMIFPLFLIIPLYIISIILWTNNTILSIFILWLAFSISFQALPSSGDLSSTFYVCAHGNEKNTYISSISETILIMSALPVLARDYGFGICYALILFQFSLNIIMYLGL